MMMMADGLLGSGSDQVIEGVTVKVDSDPEPDDDTNQFILPNGYPAKTSSHNQQLAHNQCRGTDSISDYNQSEVQEIVETLTVPFSTTSAACANCSISFFDPLGNPVYQRIFYMCLDSTSNEAIQISSVIFILFAKKLSRCSNPSPDLALCQGCAELVAQMYQLYRELDGLSAINSYINSFLPDITQVFLPTPDSSNPSVATNYAHYDDAISAAINGSSTIVTSPLLTPVEQTATPVPIPRPTFDDTSNSQPVQQKVVLSEPPPLTVPSYSVTSTSSSVVPVSSELLKPKIELDQLLNSIGFSQGSLNTLANSQTPQVQYQQEPILDSSAPKTPKRRKTVNVTTTPKTPVIESPQPPPSTSTTTSPPQDEIRQRMLSCPEEGCSKVYHGKGARASLRQHVKIVHLKQFPFACEICSKPMATRSVLDHHVKTHLGIQERAALPNATVPTPPRPPPPTEPLPSSPCPECGKVYQTEYILSLHLKTHQRDREEGRVLHRCEHENCTKQFRDKSSLRRHEQRHLSIQLTDFACSRCPLRFESRRLLKEHHANCGLEERQFQCQFAPDTCKRKFKYKHHLQNHLMFQHKLTAEEARQEVYPGLVSKETRKRGGGQKSLSDGVVVKSAEILAPPLEAQVPAPMLPPYDSVQSNSHVPSQSTTKNIGSLVPNPLDTGGGGGTYVQVPLGGSYSYHHSYPTTTQNSTLGFQRQMGGVPVIQETGNIGYAYGHGFTQSQQLSSSSSSVIQHNLSVIQQNPTLFHHSRSTNPPPLVTPTSTIIRENSGPSMSMDFHK